jgi:peptide/nickel transport system substrate-binding protein
VIDAPGPWGTGPFVLAEGYSVIDGEQATISREPFACTWLWFEDRTPTVRLVANTDYWDKRRGPHLREVVFRNDVSPERALELVCTTEGEVDILTEVSPADARRVEGSEHARLVSIDPVRAVAGVINRDAEGLSLGNKRARQALNLAINRDRLVREAMFGWAAPLAGLTPPTAITLLQRFPNRLSPYRHDPGLAAAFWRESGGANLSSRPLRIAALGAGLERVALRVTADLREALGAETETIVYRGEEELRARRLLAEKALPREWDVLILEQTAQTADAPPLELHRAFVGATGEYRAGPVVPEFEDLYAQLARRTSQVRLAQLANRVDRFVYDEALALFLCAPRALYAVNRHVDFTAYRTTFELPECRVSGEHWSRR